MNMPALDSNAFTYLVEAMSPSMGVTGVAPVDNERIALLRSFIYQDGIFSLLPAVQAEYMKIKDCDRLKKHCQVGGIHFDDVLGLDQNLVENRITALSAYHNKTNDCRILAEAEIGGLGALITFDKNLIRRLKPRSPIQIITPSDYWKRLSISGGSRPHRVPHKTNPLSKTDIWQWL